MTTKKSKNALQSINTAASSSNEAVQQVYGITADSLASQSHNSKLDQYKM